MELLYVYVVYKWGIGLLIKVSSFGHGTLIYNFHITFQHHKAF